MTLRYFLFLSTR